MSTHKIGYLCLDGLRLGILLMRLVFVRIFTCNWFCFRRCILCYILILMIDIIEAMINLFAIHGW